MAAQIHTPIGEAPQDHAEMDALPVGTVFVTAGRTYTRQPDGRWEHNGTHYMTHQFRPPTLRVQSYPEGTVVVPRPPETLAHYKWRFRDYALWSARNHGVNYEASRDVLDSLDTNLPVGRGVKVQDEECWRALPNGSMVFSGDPSTPQGFTMMEKKNGRWTRKLGPEVQYDRVTVYRVGPNGTAEPEWVTSSVTDTVAEEDGIIQFKAEVWRLGWKLKREQGWCSTYEAVLREFGITRNSMQVAGVNGIRAGQRVSPAVAATLPVGTVFKWTRQTDANVWGLYLRVNGASNAGGTIKIGGTPTCPDRNYHSSMLVLSVPQDDTYWSVNGSQSEIEAIMAALPPGITFSNSEGEPPGYIKCLDGRFASNPYQAGADGHIPAEGRWNVADFGNPPNFHIHTYPGVTL